jgi:dTDP-4-dehydrorhamnose reductase
MVARAAAEYCASIGDDVYALTRAELDVSDRAAAIERVADLGPDLVLNCAAFTGVDLAETHIEECFSANSLAVANLAAACREAGSRFLTISTDFVFDGRRDGFYSENDTPAPQGIYAKSKLDGERRALAEYDCSMVVRSGWIFGHGGTNFLSVVYDLLASGKPVQAIGDSYGTPTFAGDLARRLRELGGVGEPGIFHVVNSGPGASYAEFATLVCRLAGFDADLVQAVNAAGLVRPAPRPANSRLSCLAAERLGLDPLPHWESAVAAFLQERTA